MPFNEPTALDLQPGQIGRVEFAPEQSGSTFVLPVLAVTKEPGTEYRVKMDDQVVYGPAPIPPTDIDDLNVTFLPARKFTDSLLVEIVNVGSAEHTYSIQPIGYETTEGSL